MKHCNTTCPYCGVGCGVTARIDRGDVIEVMGDGNHPANAGRLCVKGTALAETLGHEGRLLHPSLHDEQLDWDSALALVADKLRSTRQQYGPGSVAFYLSGQLLTEDYYVANKLMKGFLGSANVDTNSRLCMSSAVAAYKRAFGEDLVPCSYEDLETCDLLLMIGSNAAWTHPVAYQRITAAKKQNPDKKIVVVDTRRTATSDIADLHLQLNPGSDAFLFAGLLHYLAREKLLDNRYIAHCTEGFEETLSVVNSMDEAVVSQATGVQLQDLRQFYQWYGATERTVSMYSQGVNQSATGTDKCNAIINCHLATGRVGKPGAGPFSITGQPNAMGGREVGGLANQLAAHMDFTPEHVDRVKRFWHATDMATTPGLKAVDMFQAALDGKVRFLWIMATNPAVSLPDSAAVQRALVQCDFVVVSDCTGNTDTALLADLLLPAAGWGEKDGTVTNSERLISRQRALLPAAGEAKPDWWIVTEVAQRLGLGEHFNYSSPADIFREHAALSAFENNGERAFDIGALQSLDDDSYNRMEPVRWPVSQVQTAEPLSEGRYFTASGRGQFIPVVPQLPGQPRQMTLNTGRLRDQWHTMTRTGLVPRLARHRDFFSIGVSPTDAMRLGLREGDLAQLENSQGAVRGLVALDEGQPKGQAFLPIHWNAQFSSCGRASEMIPAITDPVSGQPQSKYAEVALTAITTQSWGLLFTRSEPGLRGLDYWSKISVSGGYLTLIADQRDCINLRHTLAESLPRGDIAISSYNDASHGDYRETGTRDGRMIFTLFLSPTREKLPEQSWMTGIGEDNVDPTSVLAGISLQQKDIGAIICSCWEVGTKQISAAIQKGNDSVQALGAELRCGTQCGSCIPELKQLLEQNSKDCAASIPYKYHHIK